MLHGEDYHAQMFFAHHHHVVFSAEFHLRGFVVEDRGENYSVSLEGDGKLSVLSVFLLNTVTMGIF